MVETISTTFVYADHTVRYDEQFANLVRRCNDVGVRVYVDIVFNHIARGSEGSIEGTGGSTATFEERPFPAVPYSPTDFNKGCSIHRLM